MALSPVGARNLSRLEYERLAEAGYFRPGERAELVDGVVYAMTPQSSFHAAGIQLVHEALRPVIPPGTTLRVQMPLALTDDTEPEPDLALVHGGPRDHRDAHPRSALLVVEVADSSLLHDRRRKAPLYARAAIADFSDLVHGRLEVFRDPVGRGILDTLGTRSRRCGLAALAPGGANRRRRPPALRKGRFPGSGTLRAIRLAGASPCAFSSPVTPATSAAS